MNPEVAPHLLLKFLQRRGLDVELPLQILHSTWLISRRTNMPWPTMDRDLLEYVSSQITLGVIVNAEMNSRWPDELHAA